MSRMRKCFRNGLIHAWNTQGELGAKEPRGAALANIDLKVHSRIRPALCGSCKDTSGDANTRTVGETRNAPNLTNVVLHALG
jgi:hypothetical protein